MKGISEKYHTRQTTLDMQSVFVSCEIPLLVVLPGIFLYYKVALALKTLVQKREFNLKLVFFCDEVKLETFQKKQLCSTQFVRLFLDGFLGE